MRFPLNPVEHASGREPVPVLQVLVEHASGCGHVKLHYAPEMKYPRPLKG
jgi:hypothetical protein